MFSAPVDHNSCATLRSAKKRSYSSRLKRAALLAACTAVPGPQNLPAPHGERAGSPAEQVSISTSNNTASDTDTGDGDSPVQKTG